MTRSLADAHRKVAILTTQPANPAAPTVTELNNGIQASKRIKADDFTFGFADSDKVQEKTLEDTDNANAIAASNPQCAFTVFREFNAGTGNVDPVEDALFTAVKVKGTTLWVYERETGKLATAAWASSDELLGMQVLTDQWQKADSGGYVKRRVPCEPQKAYPNIAVA